MSSWQTLKQRIAHNDSRLFGIAVFLLVAAITLNEYLTPYLFIGQRPLPTESIVTKHPDAYPLPVNIRPFELGTLESPTNVAVLTFVSFDQPGEHLRDNTKASVKYNPSLDFVNMDDTDRQKRILDHPISTILLPSLIAAADSEPGYRHTVYVGFDASDPLFDDEPARQALDTRIKALIDAQAPAAPVTILFIPLSVGHSLTAKLNLLGRLAYVADPTRTRSSFSFSPDARTTALAATATSRTVLPHPRTGLFVLARPNSQFVTSGWAALTAAAFSRNTLFPGMGVLGFTDPASPAFPLALAVTSVHMGLFDGDMFQVPFERFSGAADGWLYSVYKPWGAAQDLPVHTRTQLFRDAMPAPSPVALGRPEHPSVDPTVYLQLSLPSAQVTGKRAPGNVAEVKKELARQVIKGRKRLNMIFNGYYYDSAYNGLVDERDLHAMTEAKKYHKVNVFDKTDPRTIELFRELPFGSSFGLNKVITAKSSRLINVFDGCLLVEHHCKLSSEQGNRQR